MFFKIAACGVAFVSNDVDFWTGSTSVEREMLRLGVYLTEYQLVKQRIGVILYEFFLNTDVFIEFFAYASVNGISFTFSCFELSIMGPSFSEHPPQKQTEKRTSRRIIFISILCLSYSIINNYFQYTLNVCVDTLFSIGGNSI